MTVSPKMLGELRVRSPLLASIQYFRAATMAHQTHAQIAVPPALLPLSAERAELLVRLLDGLDSASLWWLSGYTAASATALARNETRFSLTDKQIEPKRELAVEAVHAPAEAFSATVLYGSQTGNAAKLATRLHQQLVNQGLHARLVRTDSYALKTLRQEKLLYIVISTQGDGDAPEDARAFVEQLLSTRAPNLAQLQFAVLGLGDSSYPKFCSVGQAVDQRLAELGAHRLFARGDADVDLSLIAEPWLVQAQESAQELAQELAREQAKSAGKTLVKPLASVSALPVRSVAQTPQKEELFAAEVLATQRLTTPASSKDIRHLELNIEDSGLHYLPGDAVGVRVSNPPETVASLLTQLSWRADAEVSMNGQSVAVQTALSREREITRANKNFVQALAERSNAQDLQDLLKPESATQLSQALAQTQLIDWLQKYPSDWDAQTLIGLLRPLKPRLYSIASSQRSVGAELHLCVAHIAYEVAQVENLRGKRFGAASHYLASAPVAAKLPIFIEPNERFRLPVELSRDVIMIGPGTGVAPFRAFLQERIETAATGRNWLFFGNPHFRSDFLYQLEWQQALKNKHLQRLDVAFSRDFPAAGAGKTYVQQRILEQGKELYRWLENGAHLYVCGDATRMAKDVEAALVQVIASERAVPVADARDYLLELSQQKRYQRDIY
jgi:sulfite reductase (NADPH) flavoprotein alpha-component